MVRMGAFPALIATLAFAVGGCYEYVPAPPAAPAPGQTVRADVTDLAASRLTSVLGPGVIQVHGLVLRQETAAISILVDTYSTARSGLLTAGNEPVLLTYPEIRGLTMKQISRRKSVIFGAAFAAGAFLTAAVFTDLGRQLTGRDEDGDPDPEMRSGSMSKVPVGLRIPVPIR